VDRAKKELADLMSLEKNVGNLKDAGQRLQDREMCFLRMQQKPEATRTKADIVAKRKAEMIEENTQKFGE